jgi:hypothetical protein
MKTKIQEIENDNFILKYIKNQTNKGIGPFALCKFKTSNKISFKFNFDYMLSNFQNCELTFDIQKNIIQCYTPKNNINKNILYIEEQMTKESKIKNNFDMNLFIEKIGNKKISFDLIKYNISSELKFLIYTKILNIQKYLEYINIIFPIIKDAENFLAEYKKILNSENIKDKYKTIKEFKSTQNNVDNLMDKIKIKIIEIKNNINNNIPKYTFEIKGNNYIFKTKYDASNTYIFYLYKNQKFEIIIEKNNSLSINYTNPNNDIYITITEKNAINFQILNKLILYITDSTSFLGSIFSQKNNQNGTVNELFGIERGKKYLYIGNIFKDNFSGFGILMTPFFCYKGKFSNSNKSDNNGFILFEEDNHFYKGGILGDELDGKGKYQNKKGIMIEGYFEKDEIKGECKFTFNNGDEYKGEMNGNIKSGEWNYINKISGKKMKVIFNNKNNDITYIY